MIVNKHKNDSIVLVFAKRPQRGMVKTRLEPLLGAEGVLALHKELIQRVCETVRSSELCPMQLWVSAGAEDAFFAGLGEVGEIHEQQGADLGLRMAHAAETALREVSSVVIIGADCPSVDGLYLQRALALLAAGEDIVLGPAEDGGYVLLGLRRVPGCMFRGIDWGSDRVMEQTRSALSAAGESWHELPARWDVDRPEDLARYQSMIAGD